MDDLADQITVFRSADPEAEEEAAEILEALKDAGLTPTLLDDEALGVPAGAVEVRVPASQAPDAERILAHPSMPASPAPLDDSRDLDLETIFRAAGSLAEMEAMSIRAVLDANGIPSILIGAPQYPNLPFYVKVPRAQVVEARIVLAEARAAGPAAAEEAELAGETGSET